MRKLNYLFALVISSLLLSSKSISEIVVILIIGAMLFFAAGFKIWFILLGLISGSISVYFWCTPPDFSRPCEYSYSRGTFHYFRDGKVKCKINDKTFSALKGEKFYLKGDFTRTPDISDKAILFSDNVQAVKTSEKSIEFVFSNLKEKIKDNLTKELGKESGALISSLVLGLKDRVLENRNRSLKALGIIHIISISGFHINLIEMILKKINLKKAVFPFLIVYTLVIASPPAWRATLMKSGSLMARLSGRDSTASNDLINAAILQLLLCPLLIRDLSFLLTYLSTFGVISISPYISTLSKKVFPLSGGKKSQNLSLTAAALIPSLPVIQYLSPSFNPATFISNMFIVVIYSVYTIFSFLATVLSTIRIPEFLWTIMRFTDRLLNGLSVLSEYILLRYRGGVSLENYSSVYYILTAIIVLIFSIKKTGLKNYRIGIGFLVLFYLNYLHPGIDFITISRQFGTVTVRISSTEVDKIFAVPAMYKKNIRRDTELITDELEFKGYILKNTGNDLPLIFYKGSNLSVIIGKENPVINEKFSEYRIKYLRTGNKLIKWGY